MNIKNLIATTIKRSPWGIDRKDLLQNVNMRLQIRYKDTIDDRKLRRIVSEMITDDGHPIGSSPKRGYFMVSTQEDLNEATKQLHSKALSMLYREKKLKENAEHDLGEQLVLPGMQEVADIVMEQIRAEIEESKKEEKSK